MTPGSSFDADFFVIGGEYPQGTFLNDFWYSFRTRRTFKTDYGYYWSERQAVDPPPGRRDHTTVRIGKNDFIVFGGRGRNLSLEPTPCSATSGG